mmetsp:Transcript_19695/g.54696  ORF Transcript_19695/g.54696 Transcript_19695/m.54696 type:complete len:124 (+) Transcript_19695:625-996(+)
MVGVLGWSGDTMGDGSAVMILGELIGATSAGPSGVGVCVGDAAAAVCSSPFPVDAQSLAEGSRTIPAEQLKASRGATTREAGAPLIAKSRLNIESASSRHGKWSGSEIRCAEMQAAGLFARLD